MMRDPMDQFLSTLEVDTAQTLEYQWIHKNARTEAITKQYLSLERSFLGPWSMPPKLAIEQRRIVINLQLWGTSTLISDKPK